MIQHVLPTLDGTLDSAIARLEAFEEIHRRSDLEGAAYEVRDAVEELSELARGDKYPGTPGQLAMEVTRETDRAQRALSVIDTVVEDGAA